jgi:hypothetical protein
MVATSKAKTEAKILSMEDILTSEDRAIVSVNVPEWGGHLKVRPFTKRQQIDIRNTGRKPDGDVDVDSFEMQVFLAGVIEPVFTQEQYNLLLEKSAIALDRVIKEVLKINDMGPDAEKESAASFQD